MKHQGTPIAKPFQMVAKITLREFNRFVFCGVLVVAVLYFARQVLIPLFFAIFFAMLLAPLCSRLERAGFHRGLAALTGVLLIVVAVLGIALLVFAQAKTLSRDFPQIEKRSKEFFEKTQTYISTRLDVPRPKQDALINKHLKSATDKAGKAVEKMVGGIVGGFAMFAIVLIFTFLLIFQRQKYEAFFVRLSGGQTAPDEARKLVNDISTVAQSYLTGRLISICIFTLLLTAGFLIVGLRGAFLLGFLAALLTLVPYLGSIVGGLFPFAVALVTGDSGQATGTLAVVLTVNVIDNYLVEPNIVGGEVRISAFFTLLILLAGGVLWGLAGMVLFLPMLGITKIICDAVPELQPYGFLIGDQRAGKPSRKLLNKLQSLFARRRR